MMLRPHQYAFHSGQPAMHAPTRLYLGLPRSDSTGAIPDAARTAGLDYCMYIQTHYNTNHPTWALPQTN